jgi:hypothetical protein
MENTFSLRREFVPEISAELSKYVGVFYEVSSYEGKYLEGFL